MKESRTKRRAVLIATIVGNFRTWRKGQAILVLPLNGASRYVIERPRWKGRLPIMNQCCGVPRSAFAYEAKQNTTLSGQAGEN